MRIARRIALPIYYLHTKYVFAQTFHSAVNSRLPRRIKSELLLGKSSETILCTLQIFQFLLSEIGQIGVASETISRSSAAQFRKYSGLKFNANFPKHVDCVNAYTLECQRYRFSKAGIYTHTDDHQYTYYNRVGHGNKSAAALLSSIS